MPNIDTIIAYDDAPIAKQQNDRSPLGKEIFKRLKKLPPGEYPALEMLDDIIKETGEGSLEALRKFLRRCRNPKSPAARDMKDLAVEYPPTKGGRGNMGKFIKRGELIRLY